MFRKGTDNLPTTAQLRVLRIMWKKHKRRRLEKLLPAEDVDEALERCMP
jgi:hypothetical protein